MPKSSTQQPVEIEQAYAHCARLTKTHYENFPVGSFLIPRAIRPHVFSIYAFARTADDFADEPGLAANERLDRLSKWREKLDASLENPTDPIFIALGETIRTQDIPVQWLHDLLTAFRQDVTTQRHASNEDLLTYCKFSANPVGRLILHLFGYRDERLMQLSDAICSALQLANFWQDIGVDFPRGRIYLPQKDMAEFGVSESDLASQRVTNEFRLLLDLQISRTRALFNEGRPLLDIVRGRLRYELRLTWLGGVEILNLIERNQYDVFGNRPKITRGIGLRLLAKALLPGSIS